MLHNLRGFWTWWISQLSSSITLITKRKKPRNDRPTDPVIIVEKQGISFIEGNIKEWNGAICTPPDGLQEALVNQSKKFIRKFTWADLRVSPELVLKRKLTNTNLPLHTLTQAARLDLIASTPLKNDDVFLIPVPYDAGEVIGSSYYVLKKTTVEPIVSKLLEAGIRINNVKIDLAEKNVELSRNLMNSINPKLKTFDVLRKILVFLAICSLLLLVFTMIHVNSRYNAAIEIAEINSQNLSKKASRVRKLQSARVKILNKINIVRSRRSSTASVVSIWEEISRILPDTSYISEFKINGQSLTLSGFSTSAAGIIPILERSQLFNSVQFNGPVVRIPDKKLERFFINMTIVSQ